MTRMRGLGLLVFCLSSLVLASATYATDEGGFEATVALGTGWVDYTSDGHILLDVNSVALWRIDSVHGKLVGTPTDLDPGAGVRWTIPGTTKQADGFVVGEFITSNAIVCDGVFNPSTFTFDYTGQPRDLGQLLPANWLSDGLGEYSFTYQTLGGDPVTIPIPFWPEPATASLTLMGLGLFGLIRRRS